MHLSLRRRPSICVLLHPDSEKLLSKAVSAQWTMWLYGRRSVGDSALTLKRLVRRSPSLGLSLYSFPQICCSVGGCVCLLLIASHNYMPYNIAPEQLPQTLIIPTTFLDVWTDRLTWSPGLSLLFSTVQSQFVWQTLLECISIFVNHKVVDAVMLCIHPLVSQFIKMMCHFRLGCVWSAVSWAFPLRLRPLTTALYKRINHFDLRSHRLVP